MKILAFYLACNNVLMAKAYLEINRIKYFEIGSRLGEKFFVWLMTGNDCGFPSEKFERKRDAFAEILKIKNWLKENGIDIPLYVDEKRQKQH